MVGSAPQPQSQLQPPSAEEEALRRNTDCVYFLASPLTCKNGSECEYRHSDNARLNPRDCWYWLNGNCLNLKCAFRHPPLDGLLGTPVSPGPSAPVPLNMSVPAARVMNPSTKQAVACIFFQKGFCLKGDWCPFLHGPNSVGNKASLVTGTASAAEPAAMTKMVFSGIENSLQEKKAYPMNAVKFGKDPPQVKPITEVEPAPWGNEFTMNKKVLQTANFPSYRNTPLTSNGNTVGWSSRVHQSHPLEEPETVYSKDTEEVSREPSPGFDVLVDDEGRDSDYYPSEDRYGMSMEHEAGNKYDMDHSADYNMIAVVDDERYGRSLGYDSHDLHTGGHYAWEQRRASSERISGGSYRPDSRSRVDESDLRHRLGKHRNPNGLRSVVSREHTHDMQVGDREQRIPLPEKSLSSRLRGRIRLPRRSSSPVRAGISSHEGRIRNYMKGRVEEAFNNGGKDHRGMHSIKDTVRCDSADFAGPKSLAELRNRIHSEPIKQQGTDQQSLGKRKHLMLDGNRQSGSNLSFEGPKPLEEILKRKRGEMVGKTLARNSSNNQGVTQDGDCEGRNEVHKSMATQQTDAEDTKQAGLSASEQPHPSKLEPGDDGMLATNLLDHETEAHSDKYVEPDYDQAGDEDDLYDGEILDGSGERIDEEEDDDDDDDEFAKKMGVMYS